MSNNIKTPKQSVFKTPNTVDSHYGKDIPGAFELNGIGKDRFTLHLTQTTNWDTIPVTYEWNSLGLRGPEPDYTNNTRLLFAGSSQTLGVGLPLEYTYPYLVAKKLNASYINLSDIDVFTDIIDNILKVKDFNPTHIILSDTRFIQHYGFVINALSRNHLAKIYDNSEYTEVFKECDRTCLTLMELSLKQLFPDSVLMFAGAQRRLFKHSMPDFKYIKMITLSKEDAVDLARDNTHLGIETNKNFADKIYSAFATQGQ